MKSSPNNNQLDNFIQDALKSPDADLHPFDWSEIEVLLRHEQKSIRQLTDKKSILISAAVAIILIGAFGIFKIVRYYSSLPKEAETLIDSTQNTFMAVDTQKTIISDSTMIDTVKIDSSALADQEHKTDSLLAASAAFLKKINETQSADTEKIIQKQDKKQKQNKTQPQPTDTSSEKISIEQLPAIDTASKQLIPEIKNDTPSSSPDSSKSSDSSKKSKKNKKQKNTSADSSKTKTPPEAKPDSLKQ